MPLKYQKIHFCLRESHKYVMYLMDLLPCHRFRESNLILNGSLR